MASYPFVILVVYDMLTGLYVSYPGLMRFACWETAEKSRSEAGVSRWVPLWDNFFFTIRFSYIIVNFILFWFLLNYSLI